MLECHLVLSAWNPENLEESKLVTRQLAAGHSAATSLWRVAGPRRPWGIGRRLSVGQEAAGLRGGAEGAAASCSHRGLYLTRPQAGVGGLGSSRSQPGARLPLRCWGALFCTELCREMD